MKVDLPDLRVDQVDAIITESLNRGFFENDPNGTEVTDPRLRLEAAQTLVVQAVRSLWAGNRNPGVLAVLHIAEITAGDGAHTEPQPQGEAAVANAEADLAKQSDQMLEKFEQTLQNYPQSPEVEENLRLVRAEMERRGLRGPAPANGNGNGHAEEAAAPAPDDAAERAALVDRLTFPIMMAHNVDPSQVNDLTVEQLRAIVENPTGSAAPATPETPQEAPPVQGETIQTTQVVIPDPTAPAAAEPAPFRPAGAAAAAPADDERESLESQVTGPMLKAYGAGRKDVPEMSLAALRFMVEHPDGAILKIYGKKLAQFDQIGPNELAFMVANPEARVTQEEFDAAVTLDKQGETPAPAAPQPTIAEQQAAQASPAAEATPPAEPAAAPPAEAPAPPAPAAASPVQPDPDPTPDDEAAAIIARENFPIPPEITEDPPRLPFDLSKVSDAELASFHARFHACHSRMNYVVGLIESELSDEVKLRKGREVEVANNLPKADGRTKLTDAQREAMVQADPQVISHREVEHRIQRKLRQLKTLQDNYSRDVSTCSRQWAMRKNEKEGAGGLR